MTNTAKTKAMAALFCAIVVARKSQRSLPEYLKLLPLSPEIKSMVLENCRGLDE